MSSFYCTSLRVFLLEGLFEFEFGYDWFEFEKKQKDLDCWYFRQC